MSLKALRLVSRRFLRLKKQCNLVGKRHTTTPGYDGSTSFTLSGTRTLGKNRHLGNVSIAGTVDMTFKFKVEDAPDFRNRNNVLQVGNNKQRNLPRVDIVCY